MTLTILLRTAVRPLPTRWCGGPNPLQKLRHNISPFPSKNFYTSLNRLTFHAPSHSSFLRHKSRNSFNDDLNTENTKKENLFQGKSFKFITERDRLLAQATGVFEKLQINVKWILKKSMRPFNSDDISAFISWVVVSNVVIIILWTTTFTSLVIYLMNTVFAQEYLATKIGNLLTKNSSLSVVFESAIVPDWSSGKICFNKVFVSRRPKLSHSFIKGTQKEAIQRTELALSEQILVKREDFDDGNYTQYDLTIDQLEISLSFTNWLNGKGILDEVSISGMRGVVDRTHVVWKPNDSPTNYKNIHQPGDFEISKFTMQDVLFTLYQPNGFRPFLVSIFNCDLPQLRKHWLFYDILNANSMSGTYDNSLFTIHRKYIVENMPSSSSTLPLSSDASAWKRVTRFRVDNLNIDHLNAGMDGPFGWITEGQVDMIGDVLLPDKEADASQLTEVLTEIGDRLFKEAQRYSLIPSSQKPNASDIDPDKYFMMDFFLRLHNVKAEVPLFTPELGYMNNALIRPIVGYINSTRTYIPIRCRVVKNISDFEGSWTIYDCLLMRDLSAEIYDAFAEYVADDRKRSVRLMRVGFWSLQIILQVIFMSLGAIA